MFIVVTISYWTTSGNGVKYKNGNAPESFFDHHYAMNQPDRLSRFYVINHQTYNRDTITLLYTSRAYDKRFHKCTR